MCVHRSSAGPGEDAGWLGNGIRGGCESPCQCWGSNPDLLGEQPSLQPLLNVFQKMLK